MPTRIKMYEIPATMKMTTPFTIHIFPSRRFLHAMGFSCGGLKPQLGQLLRVAESAGLGVFIIAGSSLAAVVGVLAAYAGFA